MPGGEGFAAGNGTLQRVRDLERRTTRVEQRVDRIEDGDQQGVILERLSGALSQIAELRNEVKWLRRTLIAGVVAVVLPLVILVLQLGTIGG